MFGYIWYTSHYCIHSIFILDPAVLMSSCVQAYIQICVHTLMYLYVHWFIPSLNCFLLPPLSPPLLCFCNICWWMISLIYTCLALCSIMYLRHSCIWLVLHCNMCVYMYFIYIYTYVHALEYRHLSACTIHTCMSTNKYVCMYVH